MAIENSDQRGSSISETHSKSREHWTPPPPTNSSSHSSPQTSSQVPPGRLGDPGKQMLKCSSLSQRRDVSLWEMSTTKPPLGAGPADGTAKFMLYSSLEILLHLTGRTTAKRNVCQFLDLPSQTVKILTVINLRREPCAQHFSTSEFHPIHVIPCNYITVGEFLKATYF